MVSAIIVSAGKGVRMNDTFRKQYINLSGLPVVAHSVITFEKCRSIEEIFMVVPEEDIDYCQKEILSLLELKKAVHLVPGGVQRQDSVYNGLQAVDKNTDTVVIHDGVRPFIQADDLMACIQGSKDFGACILGIPASDTLKRVGKSEIIKGTLTRDRIWLAQTPQAFRYDLILKAHEAAQRDGYIGTDDASLLERLGMDVKIITGSRFNLKITLKEDLAVARALCDAGLI